MARPGEPIPVPCDALAHRSHATTTSVSLPLAVHQRLDELVDLATATNTSRQELLAALVALETIDREALERRVMAYRRLKVSDLVGSPAEGDVVHFLPRTVGRPARRRRS